MAQFYNDLPGVRRKEIDISDYLGTRTGLTVGSAIRSTQGRINRPYVVTSQNEFINNFGTPYFGSGTPKVVEGYETAYVPDLGYGSHAVYYTLAETSSMVVVRDAAITDKYSTVNLTGFNRATSGTSAVGFGATSAAVSPRLWVEGQMYDTNTYISSIETSATDNTIRVSHVAPSVNGNNYSVAIEFLSSASEWAYKFDNYPVVSAGTVESVVFASTSAMTQYLPKASEICKLTVYGKQTTKAWTDYYSSSADQAADKLRITPIETYFVSFKKILDDDGNSLYAPDVINNSSSNIYVNVGKNRSDISISAVGITNAQTSSTLIPTGSDSAGFYVKSASLAKLGGGYYDLTNNKTSSSSWSMLHDRKQIVLDFVLGYSANADEKIYAGNIVSDRRDCFAEIQSHPVQTVEVADIIANETYSYAATSYVGLNAGFSKVFDSFNGRDVFLPNCIFALAADLRTIRNGKPWDVPAGVTRGAVPVKAQMKIYSDGELDRLCSRNINPVTFERGYGFIIISYRTAQLKKSALDRKNVRLNLLYIENNIETFLKQFLFEINTPSTRLRAFVGGNDFLDTIKKSGGLYDYIVVCDETNNGEAVIDSNTMNYTIGVQPVKGIDWINFTTVVTRTGADFNSIMTQYA